MFDNLRQKSAEQAEFLNDDEVPPAAGQPPKPPKPPKARRPKSGGGGGGMSIGPGQRFFLALMLFLSVTVLGCFALVVFEKIALPLF